MEAKDWINLSAQVLVFAGFVFAVLKYAQEKKREFQKRFFEEQLKIYSEAVDYASTISLYDKGEAEYINAVRNFQRLFWGKMCIVEDAKVEGQMKQFGILLAQYEAEKSAAKCSVMRANLQQKGLALAHACRNSSLRTWGINYNLKGYNNYALPAPKDPTRTDSSDKTEKNVVVSV